MPVATWPVTFFCLPGCLHLLHKICIGLLWSFFLDLIGLWNCFDNDFGGREFSRNSHSGTFSQIYPRIGDVVVTVKETGRCFRVKIVSVPFGSGIGVDRVCVFLLIFLIWFPCSNEFTSPTPTTKATFLLLFKLYYLTYYTLNGLGNTCTAHSRVHVRYELSIHDRADTATNWVRMLVNCKRYQYMQRNKNNNISILRQNDSIFDISTDVFILQAQTKTGKFAISRKVSVEPP